MLYHYQDSVCSYGFCIVRYNILASNYIISCQSVVDKYLWPAMPATDLHVPFLVLCACTLFGNDLKKQANSI